MTWCIGLMLIIVCAAWAFGSSGKALSADFDIDSLSASKQEQTTEPSIAALDLSVFTAKLWNPPPPATQVTEVAAQPAPSVPREPLNLQLIGITEDNGRRIAALYDPRTDSLHLVGDGQTIGRLRVTAITDQYVELDDGRGPRKVELEPANAARSGRTRS